MSCPSDKKVVGCHLKDGHDKWKSFYPNPDGQSCSCSDSIGADCIASCAAGITGTYFYLCRQQDMKWLFRPSKPTA